MSEGRRGKGRAREGRKRRSDITPVTSDSKHAVSCQAPCVALRNCSPIIDLPDKGMLGVTTQSLCRPRWYPQRQRWLKP